MFNRVTAVVLFVQDFEKALAFYRDTLELPVAVVEETFAAFKMQDQDFAINALPSAADMVKVEESAFDRPATSINRMLLCTRVDDVDAIYEKLVAKGVTITQAPTDQYWGLRTVFFLDPEGNMWEFATPIAEK